MERAGPIYPDVPEFYTMKIDGSDATSEFDVHASAGVLVNQPGMIHEYGMDSDIVGGLLEAVYAKKHPASPLRLEHIMQRELWGPLGMQNTFFYLDSTRADFTRLQAHALSRCIAAMDSHVSLAALANTKSKRDILLFMVFFFGLRSHQIRVARYRIEFFEKQRLFGAQKKHR